MDIQEPPHDVVAGSAVDEEEVIVLEARICRAFLPHRSFVQPHDRRHVVL